MSGVMNISFVFGVGNLSVTNSQEHMNPDTPGSHQHRIWRIKMTS
jgi:hypothetical protein